MTETRLARAELAAPFLRERLAKLRNLNFWSVESTEHKDLVEGQLKQIEGVVEEYERATQ